MTDPDPVYLDYNATTPVHDEVAAAMRPYFDKHFGNPSSGHVYGERADRAVEKAREQVAELIGARPREVVFTSGGTESNNLALRGAARGFTAPGRIVTSTVEHPAVDATCDRLGHGGWDVARVGVDGDGRLDTGAFEETLDEDTEIVSVMHANNETGVVQPVERCAALADDVGAIVHTDAAQTVGKIPVDVDDLGIDLLTMAGHKLYAPKGIGALYVREGTPLEPILHGASHERGLRPGTEPVPAIVGLGAACALAKRDGAEAMRCVEQLRDRLWARLQEEIPGLVLNGQPAERLPNTLNVRFPDVRGDRLLEAATEVAASTGSACHEGGERRASEVVTAMGVDPDAALGSVRLTLGRQTTAEDVERAGESLCEAWRELRWAT
ncbi:MAG: cysteine desulfurase family protein [Bradymonadaceae bacterium]